MSRLESVPRWVGVVALLALLVALLTVGVGVGASGVGLGSAWRTLLGGTGGREVIVRDLRVPRGLLAVVVGVALGLAGALMQGLTRNPLADPGLLGINAGAAAAVVLGVGVLGVSAPSGQVWLGLVGAGLAMVVVLLLSAASRGRPGPDRVVLAGAATTAVLIALVQGAQVASPTTFDVLRRWNLGSLADRGVDVLAAVTPLIAVAAVAGLFLARGLDVLALGDRTSTGLGARTVRVQIGAGLCATVLCGAATAAAGPIAFLGLAVPHVVRAVVGPAHRWLLIHSALLAPSVLLVADLVGRVARPPSEVPVGVVTALLGAPVFIAVCRRRRLMSL